MASQLDLVLKTTVWGIGFTIAGCVAGTLSDGIIGSRLGMKSAPLLAGLSQLTIGIALLSELIAMVMPPDTVAPLSDGLMFYWFMEAQPTLKENMKKGLAALRSRIFFPMKTFSPATPAPTTDDVTAPAPSPTQVVSDVKLPYRGVTSGFKSSPAVALPDGAMIPALSGGLDLSSSKSSPFSVW